MKSREEEWYGFTFDFEFMGAKVTAKGKVHLDLHCSTEWDNDPYPVELTYIDDFELIDFIIEEFDSSDSIFELELFNENKNAFKGLCDFIENKITKDNIKVEDLW